jgi:hypothetical protein
MQARRVRPNFYNYKKFRVFHQKIKKFGVDY